MNHCGTGVCSFKHTKNHLCAHTMSGERATLYFLGVCVCVCVVHAHTHTLIWTDAKCCYAPEHKASLLLVLALRYFIAPKTTCHRRSVQSFAFVIFSICRAYKWKKPRHSSLFLAENAHLREEEGEEMGHRAGKLLTHLLFCLRVPQIACLPQLAKGDPEPEDGPVRRLCSSLARQVCACVHMATI